jgi:hypothetical protein
VIKKLYTTSIIIFVLGLCSLSANAAEIVELTPSSRVILHVDPGMSIDQIVRKVYPTEVELWLDIRNKLIELNPYSFHPNSNRLVAGSRLKLVDVKRVAAQERNIKSKVGYVVRQQGPVTVKDLNGETQQLEINSPIYEGDRITTGMKSTAFIAMDDGAEIYLKEDSVVKISTYIITSGFDKDSSSIIDLLKGGLRKITGSIGASALSNYQVKTGLATIGIRGTEYVIKLCKLDDCNQTVSRNDPDAKLHAVVLNGAITMTTREDVQILMATGEYGTASRQELVVLDDATIPPGLLDSEESTQFVTTAQQMDKADESSSRTKHMWAWILGILLIAVGL